MNNKKTIIIFGANGLLGFELTKYLVREKNTVIAVDKTHSKFKNLTRENLIIKKMDVTNFSKLGNFILNEKKVNSIINCLYIKNKTYGRKIEKITTKSFIQNISNNLGASFSIYKSSYLRFKRKKLPIDIISISSIYSFFTPRFDIYEKTNITMPIDYASYKASLINMNKYFAKYVNDSKFKCNCISPGGLEDKQQKIFKQNYSKYTFSKKMLDVEDIIPTIYFLLSDKSSKINGQNIIIDDGFTT